MAQYFLEKHFKENFQKIIARYINLDNYNFIESLGDNTESQISLLTREKEIQLAHLKKEIQTRNLGIILLSIVGISLVFIVLLFRKSQQLIKEIEHQQKNIAAQNRELEIKNKKLEEFTFANAHKLHAPVATVLGLIQLFDFCEPGDNDRIMELLKQSSFDLDHEVKAIRVKLEEEDLLTGSGKYN
jgi:signal transduction histidine kinase